MIENIRNWIVPAVVIGGVVWNALFLPQQIYADLNTRYASRERVDMIIDSLERIEAKLDRHLETFR
jgi:hypothetical protein